MRLLICGGRDWTDRRTILFWIKSIKPDLVIEGEAKGADTLARKAAESLSIAVKGYPAQWSLYGRSAGHIRNIQMLDSSQPDLVLAFHADIKDSKGTLHMITEACRRGIPVHLVTGVLDAKEDHEQS